MRNSELMRRRANVSTLDLGRIKSDREAIGEISQEEKDGHSFSDCMYHFAFFPLPRRWPTYALRTGAAWVTITRIHTYIILKQLAPTYACSITHLKCLITASVVMQLLWVTADTTRKCINGGICKEDRPSSSHVSAAALQHHNRTHLKF